MLRVGSTSPCVANHLKYLHEYSILPVKADNTNHRGVCLTLSMPPLGHGLLSGSHLVVSTI